MEDIDGGQGMCNLNRKMIPVTAPQNYRSHPKFFHHVVEILRWINFDDKNMFSLNLYQIILTYLTFA